MQLTTAGMRQLQSLGVSVTFYALYNLAFELFFFVAWFTVALIIFWRKSDEPLAWFVALTLLTFGVAFPGFAEQSRNQNLVFWILATVVLFIAVSSIIIFFYVFPDGRFVPRWMRSLTILWMPWSLYWMLAPDNVSHNFYYNTYYVALIIGVCAQIHRYRRASSLIQKQQTKWVVFGVTIAIAIFISLNAGGMLLPAAVQRNAVLQLFAQPAYYVFMSFIPLSIGIAILRYRLWDIDVIIKRTLVYGALTASVIGIYILLVGYLGTLFQTSGNLVISLAATGLVAVLFQPLRDRLQRGVNRLLYGERDEPYAVISRLGQRLEATLAPAAVLPTIVETVREALKLPYAAVVLKQGELFVTAAESGARAPSSIEDTTAEPSHDSAWSPAPLVSLALTYQGEAVGQLLLAPRAAGEGFSPADRRLLDDLARQAGVAAHAVRLTADLQRSRERLVSAREEERRRLRRDLHDGLGPQLAGLTLKLDAARNLLHNNPAAAKALLDELRTQAQTSIADIRRLVYALRPPALDDLGLVGALREQARQYEQRDLAIDVVAPEQLPALPAAVEVAAYRIAQEALTNVVKHANAHHCRVELALESALRVTITDDGSGLPAERRAGVGLSSMAERAEELGGTCEIVPAPGGGTCVAAWLPL